MNAGAYARNEQRRIKNEAIGKQWSLGLREDWKLPFVSAVAKY